VMQPTKYLRTSPYGFSGEDF